MSPHEGGVATDDNTEHRDEDSLPFPVRLLRTLLICYRVCYHAAYLAFSPFALVTFSDGQLYEEAARDLAAHFPLGSQPFYLQGLYAYVLSLPLAFGAPLWVALVLQLGLCAFALWLFARAARHLFGPMTAALSTCVLLAYPTLAFMENKYLSVSIGIVCNTLALYAFTRARQTPSAATACFLGFASGLAALGRPNMLLAAPFTAYAYWLVCDALEPYRARRGLAALFVGICIALAPMALRNAAVVGEPLIFPSHGGGIPFYLGNNPHANGRWNTAGGLVSGQVGMEQTELADKLGLTQLHGSARDEAIGQALYAKAFRYMRDDPAHWLALEGRKLWYTLGNDELARDYEITGERELLSEWFVRGLPFGVLLAFGVLGWLSVNKSLAAGSAKRAATGLHVFITGQCVAILSASLLYFSSDENRLPLAVPLALLCGPGLRACVPNRGWRMAAARLTRMQVAAGACCALLLVQAFVPRVHAEGPSAVHYFNLAQAEEYLGRPLAALLHYGQASARKPQQPVFALHHARMLRLNGHISAASAEIERVSQMPKPTHALQDAIARERAALRTAGPSR